MIGRPAVLFVALVLLSADSPSLVSAQSPPEGPAGIIRGRITAADTGRPLRRAQVTVAAPELDMPRTVNTGLDGRYEIRDLPEGRYSVSARRSGYLPLEYGQRRPLEQARPLQLSNGATLADVDFALPSMSVITGRVLDDGGEPIADALVQVLQPAWIEGRRQLAIVEMTAPPGTDDTGQFRIAGLPPGAYYVRASTRETWTVTSSGRRELMGFAPTYFPSSPYPDEARLVELGVGQRVTADVLLVPARPARVAGLAFDSRGQPLAGRRVNLVQRFIRAGAGGGAQGAGSAQVGPDGTFLFPSLPLGEYRFSVSTGNVITGEGELAEVSVNVAGDLDGLVLTTSAGWSIAGRIVTDDGSAPPFPLSGMRLGATRSLQIERFDRGATEIRDDWTFTIRGIVGAERVWTIVPDGWMVTAIRHEGRDITSSLLELRSGAVLDGVEVVIADRLTRIRGRLLDARGAPAPNGTIVVFPDDADRWGESTAFVRTARPDQGGHYEIVALPAAEYLAVALDYVRDGLWNDPEFLASLRPYAQRFTLDDGASHALDLQVIQP